MPPRLVAGWTARSVPPPLSIPDGCAFAPRLVAGPLRCMETRRTVVSFPASPTREKSRFNTDARGEADSIGDFALRCPSVRSRRGADDGAPFPTSINDEYQRAKKQTSMEMDRAMGWQADQRTMHTLSTAVRKSRSGKRAIICEAATAIAEDAPLGWRILDPPPTLSTQANLRRSHLGLLADLKSAAQGSTKRRHKATAPRLQGSHPASSSS